MTSAAGLSFHFTTGPLHWANKGIGHGEEASLHCSARTHGKRQLWAAREGDPNTLDFNGFRDGQCIFEFDA